MDKAQLKKLYGPRYRYFTRDPENKGRGSGYYRVFRGMYFKKPENGDKKKGVSGLAS